MRERHVFCASSARVCSLRFHLLIKDTILKMPNYEELKILPGESRAAFTKRKHRHSAQMSREHKRRRTMEMEQENQTMRQQLDVINKRLKIVEEQNSLLLDMVNNKKTGTSTTDSLGEQWQEAQDEFKHDSTSSSVSTTSTLEEVAVGGLHSAAVSKFGNSEQYSLFSNIQQRSPAATSTMADNNTRMKMNQMRSLWMLCYAILSTTKSTYQQSQTQLSTILCQLLLNPPMNVKNLSHPTYLNSTVLQALNLFRRRHGHQLSRMTLFQHRRSMIENGRIKSLKSVLGILSREIYNNNNRRNSHGTMTPRVVTVMVIMRCLVQIMQTFSSDHQ